MWSKFVNIFRKQTPPESTEPAEPTEFELLEDRLRKLQKRERRQAQILEQMYQDLGGKLDRVLAQQSRELPIDEITVCAENLAFYYQHHPQDNALAQTWKKFTVMLEALGIELILDHHQRFDDTRHQVCDIRNDPQAPDNAVLEVVRPGLVVHGQITRPAVVVVNRTSNPEGSGELF
ncbi:MAG: nucleotide exchange factor GrpE [Desulfovermiculus sp.]